jgi:hypothetical protein
MFYGLLWVVGGLCNLLQMQMDVAQVSSALLVSLFQNPLQNSAGNLSEGTSLLLVLEFTSFFFLHC